MKKILAILLATMLLLATVPASVLGMLAVAAEPVVETVYVDAGYTGTDSDGSIEKPFLNLNTAFYYLTTVTGVDEGVILVTGDTPIAETVQSKAVYGGASRYFLQNFSNMSGGKKMTAVLQLPALSFPVVIRGAGGNLTQKVSKKTDLADPTLLKNQNIKTIGEAHLVVYIKSSS